MKRPRTYSGYAQDAAHALGLRIREARLRRRWSEQELADRIGATRGTVARIERGELGVGIGLVFEAATLLGIPLFEDRSQLKVDIEHTTSLLALMPRRAMPLRTEVDDDF